MQSYPQATPRPTGGSNGILKILQCNTHSQTQEPSKCRLKVVQAVVIHTGNSLDPTAYSKSFMQYPGQSQYPGSNSMLKSLSCNTHMQLPGPQRHNQSPSCNSHGQFSESNGIHTVIHAAVLLTGNSQDPNAILESTSCHNSHNQDPDSNGILKVLPAITANSTKAPTA